MKKILLLAAILIATLTVSSCEKAPDDSWTATVETLDPTDVRAESAYLNAKITWSCKAKYAYETGFVIKAEPGATYYDPKAYCIRKDINQLEGTMELHEINRHITTGDDTYYYVAYFRMMSGKGEKFIYGQEKSYHVPGK